MECAIRETEEETKRKTEILNEFKPTVEKYISSNGEDCECYLYLAIDKGVSSNSSTDTHEVYWAGLDEVEQKLSYESLKNIWFLVKDKVQTLFENKV